MTQPSGPVLRDIHLPPAPSWWPPAPGWWLLAFICLFLLVVAVMMLRKARRKRRRRHDILSELDSSIARARGDSVRLAAELSQFLRRIAVHEDPAAAGWQGQRWLTYLDERNNGDEFRQGVGRVLVDAPYRPAASYDNVALIALVRRWTRDVLDSGALNV